MTSYKNSQYNIPLCAQMLPNREKHAIKTGLHTNLLHLASFLHMVSLIFTFNKFSNRHLTVEKGCLGGIKKRKQQKSDKPPPFSGKVSIFAAGAYPCTIIKKTFR